MKPIILTEKAQAAVRELFISKFDKEFANYRFNMNDTKLSFSFDVSAEAKEKVTILYSQAAYVRMMALVDYYDTEVGWYGLVDKISDKLYYVYDVKVCKQYVSGGKVDTEDSDTLDFFNSLTDEEIEHMHFQAHSHVRMGTGASGLDLQNQANVIKNAGMKGFYIFQIWNKSYDINTYLYDMDNNTFYDHRDVLIEIEDVDHGSISSFIGSTLDLVVEKKYGNYKGSSEFDKDQGKKNTKEPVSLPSAGGVTSDWEDWE